MRTILEGLTGTGKSETLAALTASGAAPALLISEDDTFGDAMLEIERGQIDLHRLVAICDRLEREQPSDFLLERFHFSYFALAPQWNLYRDIDARLAALEANVVLLVLPEAELRSRSLMRKEYSEQDWQGFVGHFGSEEAALRALRDSQARRVEALSLSALPSRIVDTSAKSWSVYADVLR